MGVALTKQGYALPKASERIYQKIEGVLGKFDKNIDLVTCPRKIKTKAPSPVRFLSADFDYNKERIDLKWKAPLDRGGLEVEFMIQRVDPIGLVSMETSDAKRGRLVGELIVPGQKFWNFREASVLGADYGGVYAFAVIAFNARGESEPTYIVIDTANPSPNTRPEGPTGIPYYASCWEADRARVTPIFDIISPDLYDENRHLDGDNDGQGCDPTWRR